MAATASEANAETNLAAREAGPTEAEGRAQRWEKAEEPAADEAAPTAQTADVPTIHEHPEHPKHAEHPDFLGAPDLLDHLADWGPKETPAGTFQLIPVRIARDLPLISRWMNDPAVAAFWDLGGSESVAEEHLRRQLAGDGRSVPCLGVLEGKPMSYWEIYRADLDLLARHYPARPHDTGLHLLVGGVADRAQGLGGSLLRAVSDLVLDHRPTCARVVAEPDIRNTPSVAAFLNAGFRFAAEVDLPAKRAALMIRDRSLRDLL
ncbi:GNAT family N-acetyltransferase [Streptomyces sp. NPDC088387]|uniref:GNAT family N-acetyltransferase n=1 Tax=Streptomyces sp. NPDC088387 TaxID=3365859 RepID=UPI00382CB87A